MLNSLVELMRMISAAPTRSDENPRAPFILTRDSVCMGDDIHAPHERVVEVPHLPDPVAFTRSVAVGYLASVAGIGHTWTCLLNDAPIAEVSVFGVRPLTSTVSFAAINRVHFYYHAAAY